MRLRIDNRFILWTVLILAALVLAILFQVTGLRFVIGIAVVLVPVFLILMKFGFDITETLIYSLFIGLPLFATFTYYLGLLFGRFSIGIIVSIVVFYAVFFLLNIKPIKAIIAKEKIQ